MWRPPSLAAGKRGACDSARLLSRVRRAAAGSSSKPPLQERSLRERCRWAHPHSINVLAYLPCTYAVCFPTLVQNGASALYASLSHPKTNVEAKRRLMGDRTYIPNGLAHLRERPQQAECAPFMGSGARRAAWPAARGYKLRRPHTSEAPFWRVAARKDAVEPPVGNGLRVDSAKHGFRRCAVFREAEGLLLRGLLAFFPAVFIHRKLESQNGAVDGLTMGGRASALSGEAVSHAAVERGERPGARGTSFHIASTKHNRTPASTWRAAMVWSRPMGYRCGVGLMGPFLHMPRVRDSPQRPLGRRPDPQWRDETGSWSSPGACSSPPRRTWPPPGCPLG